MTDSGPFLRPATDHDLNFLYLLAADTDPAWVRLCESGLPTPPTFADRVWQGVFALLVVVDDMDDIPLGVTSIYGANERDRTCWVETVVRSDVLDPTVEYWATETILDRAFGRCSFRKAYMSFPVWLPPRVPDKWTTSEQVRLPDHLYHQGMYSDMSIVSFEPATR